MNLTLQVTSPCNVHKIDEGTLDCVVYLMLVDYLKALKVEASQIYTFLLSMFAHLIFFRSHNCPFSLASEVSEVLLTSVQ